MRITQRNLQQIIREELQTNLKESSVPRPYYPPGDPRNVAARPAAAPLKAIDPQLVTSEQRYRELTGILKQLVEKLIVIRRSSGDIQETSFLAYDPLNKYIFLTWDESGSIAVKPSPLDSDFININRPTRALLTQLQSLTFPTFDVKASAGGAYPNAFVSYVEPEGVRFTFPVGTDYLIFGNFRGEIDLCTVPSAQNEGPLMRKCARTKYVSSSDM